MAAPSKENVDFFSFLPTINNQPPHLHISHPIPSLALSEEEEEGKNLKQI